MAPAGKDFDECFGKLVGCSHMSGLCARCLRPLALMKSADWGPNQFLALG
jgi:hypothetical protein